MVNTRCTDRVTCIQYCVCTGFGSVLHGPNHSVKTTQCSTALYLSAITLHHKSKQHWTAIPYLNFLLGGHLRVVSKVPLAEKEDEGVVLVVITV